MTRQALIKELENWKPVLLRATRRKNADFLLHVVSDREMQKIKGLLMERDDFRGREARKIASEKMVNVLAFPEPDGFPEPENGKKMLGEVYLNYDFISHDPREAKNGKKGDINILGPLFIHGFLHLLGYLHWTNRDTMKMQKEEKRLLVLVQNHEL